MKDNATILLVDDEHDIIEMLSYNLQQEGFRVISANNGIDGFALAKAERPELMVLDIMMPGIDGVELCQKIRQEPAIKDALIALLTARNEDYSQIAGFYAGADDYITKPLKPRVFVSRVKALLKRKKANAAAESLMEYGGIKVDLERVEVYAEGKVLHLPKKEFELLVLLMSRPGKVFKREKIYNSIWGAEQYVGDRTIDVHIRKLREKLGNERIHTVKGVGYKFAEVA